MKHLIGKYSFTAPLLAYMLLVNPARAASIDVSYAFTGTGNVVGATDTSLTLDATANGFLTSNDAGFKMAWNPVSYSDESVLDLNTGLLNGTFTMLLADGSRLMGHIFEDDSAVGETGPFTQILTFAGGTGEFAGVTGSLSGSGFVGISDFTVSGSGTLNTVAATPEPASVTLLIGGLALLISSGRRRI